MAIVAWCGKSGDRNPASWVCDTGWCGMGEGRLLYSDCREREAIDVEGMSEEETAVCGLSVPWWESRCMWESSPAWPILEGVSGGVVPLLGSVAATEPTLDECPVEADHVENAEWDKGGVLKSDRGECTPRR